ncbi:MAG: Rieske 2Fe-2S domain-containing protein [Devosia sp.]|nr:Rieske 2Fe-2S domain-containing protein [Devosia sp.]
MEYPNSELRRAAWYPIASSEDLPFRHVYHGQLLGHEMAVWRADDGHVNVWENRCLHRGVRLSIGINEGAELKCQYHGWRYANRSAGCTYIPAHPADAPARRISNRTYPMLEAHGLVWSALDRPDGDDLPVPQGDWLPLRPMPVQSTPEAVLAGLAARRVTGSGLERLTPLGVAMVLAGMDGRRALLYVQPVDSARAVIRGLVERPAMGTLEVLRRFDTRLAALRDALEAEALQHEQPAPLVPVFQPVSIELATMPDLTIGRQATLRVRVARKWAAGEGVTGLELAALEGHLPTFQPGAHIDLHLPNGLVRQYSITNGPGELLAYRIAVKREPGSRGGSAAICDELRVGDVVAISEPRNNFPLRRDATQSILIAGGIGATPLLSMAKALQRSRLGFAFHAFARSEALLPLADELEALGDDLVRHLGLDPDETAAQIRDILGPYSFSRQVYVCGPAPMLELTRSLAAELGWPDEAVHFEYFSNTRPIDTSSSFVVELARSALSLTVPPGKSILEVLRENGIAAPSSCEQGACGTCLTRVLKGEPEHQDVYLNASERAANTTMMTCVSRARSARLVLDI